MFKHKLYIVIVTVTSLVVFMLAMRLVWKQTSPVTASTQNPDDELYYVAG